MPTQSESQFLDRIKADPLDEQIRLEYLKWLDESGDSKAKFVRLKFDQMEQQKKLIEIEWSLQNSSVGISEDWMNIVFPLDIRSPMLGRIYLQPTPDARPYIAKGDFIELDTTIALIEAMKIFNDIKAGVRGIVTEICVSNGQAVEYNHLLFKVTHPPRPIIGG